MRLSTFKLWVSAGLSLLVVEFLLFVGFAIWTKTELSRMERELQDRAEKSMEENERLSREMRTVNRKLRERVTEEIILIPDGEPFEPSDLPENTEVRPADLINQFRDAVVMEDTDAEKAAAGSLRAMGVRGAKALIMAISSEPSGFMRSHLFRLLGMIPVQESLGFLQSEFGSQTEKAIQLAILDGLILHPDSSSLPLFKTALVGERDGEVRDKILEAIKSIGSGEAARVLIQEFQQASGGGRSRILKMMAGMKASPLGGFFQDLLQNSNNASFRIMSIQGLVVLGESSVIPVLESVRDNDPDEKVKEEAESAIQALQG